VQVRRTLTALAGIAAWLALSGPAAADVYDDNPATASRGGGDAWIFARANDGAVLERHWTGSAWTDWSSLGGNTTSGPAAVGYGGTVHVFARGTDGAIYENVYSGGWSGWSSLGGYATSAPAASVRRGAAGYIDIAVKGLDNAIYFQTFVPGRGWSGWASRGGSLTTAPALNSQSDGIVNIWSRGVDGAVKQMAWNGSAWSDWMDLSGGIFGAPAAVSRTENVVNIYVRGTNNATYQRAWTAGGGWGAWALLDQTPIDSSPAAAGDGPLHEWIVARGGSGLVLKQWNGSGWSSWTDLGPIAVPVAPAPVPTATLEGEVNLETGLRCTPAGGKLSVRIRVRKPKHGPRARVARIVFYTKGKGRAVRIDHRAPYAVRLPVNKPAGKSGRVFARVYYRRSKHGPLHRKTVSRRYVVCG
jgi:hypothetical protein